MKLRSRLRRAFTIVELLVVIGIIGMLIALLVPAVQAARESARANDCRNNLKNWALAVTQYDLNRGYFPGFLNDIRNNRTSSPNPGNWGDNSERSWMFVVLPYMDNRALYDREHENMAAGRDGTPNLQITHTLEVAICKSNPPDQPGMGLTSYAANVGQVDRSTGNVARAIPTPLPTVAAGQTKDGIGNGVFHFRGYPHIPGEMLVTERGTYIASQDGQTNTVLLSENVDSFMWSTPYERFGVGYCSQAGVSGTGSPQALVGMPWKINEYRGQGHFPSGGSQMPSMWWPPNAPLWDYDYMRPSSYHPGGVNIAFCDGRVHFVSEGMAYSAFQAIMTPRGSVAYDNRQSAWPPPKYPSTAGPASVTSADDIQ